MPFPPQDWQAAVSEAVQNDGYQLVAPPGAPPQLGNPAWGLAVSLDDDAVHVRRPGTVVDLLALRLDRFGRDGSLRPAGDAVAVPGACSSDDRKDARGECLRRGEYDRPGVVEWWQSGVSGLEQGFTVPERPDGDGPLVFEIRADGAAVDGDELGDEVWLSTDAGDVRYSGPVAVDADGNELPTILEADGDTIRVVVDDEGAAYPIDVDPLLTTVGWSAKGTVASGFYGLAIGYVGDVDKDGYADLAVASPLYSNGQTYEGAVYIYKGSASGPATTPSLTLETNVNWGLLGYIGTIATADVNCDGYSDVLAPMPYYTNGQTYEGGVVVFKGTSTSVSTTPTAFLESNVAYALASQYSPIVTGDFNKDGCKDVAVGAPVSYGGASTPVYYGGAFVWKGATTLTTSPWTTYSPPVTSYTTYYGWSLGAVDVDKDGYDDLLVSAPTLATTSTNDGAVYTYKGSSTGLSTTSSAKWTGTSAYHQYGFGVAVGDFTGDGYKDVAIGATGVSDPESYEGAVYTYLGSATGLSSSVSTTSESNAAGSWPYVGLAALDADKDGKQDLLVGSPYYSNGQTYEGRAYLFKGTATGLASSPSWAVESDQANAMLGFYVANAGDVDKNGLDDALVNVAWWDDGATADVGAAWLYKDDTDQDGDTVPDSVEGTSADTDGDGVKNYLDSDDDGDGVLTSSEGPYWIAQDSDKDGKADYLDTDDDADGVPTLTEGSSADTDGDGTKDYLDTDADGDGIADSVEGTTDHDGDGASDYADADDDGDGLPTKTEGSTADSDKDGTKDYLDADDDGDGVLTLTEGSTADTDADGTKDWLDADDDGDGLATSAEGSSADTDGDGTPDWRDADDDGDGLLTKTEGSSADTDGDGTKDYLDADDDGDGVPTLTEGTTDSDGDGVGDWKDADDDGDGLLTATEGTTDADGDGVGDWLDTDSDGDDVLDGDEIVGDTDGDGTVDRDDADDDGDGVLTATEGSTADTDGDGAYDWLDPDDDGDGVATVVEGSTADTDADGTPDWLDADDDGDGVATATEGTADGDKDGLGDWLDTDSDGDGLGDGAEVDGDTDGDGLADRDDRDDDDDGLLTSIESKTDDADGDGLVDDLDPDSDDDGYGDGVEGLTDTDGDGLADALDTDSDADGVQDIDEPDTDTDGDGFDDRVDDDDDGDGVPTADELAFGSDPLDADTDGDGVPDGTEWGPDAAPRDTDGDGVPDVLDDDDDGDGLETADELAVGTDAYATDSDGDGLSDADEVGDVSAPTDTDADGEIDALDPDDDGDGVLTADEAAIGTDPHDTDSDDDGVPDGTEVGDVTAPTDTDADGQIDALDPDDDGDGLLTEVEGTDDLDGDGTGNWRDTDDDGDGVLDADEPGDADCNDVPDWQDPQSRDHCQGGNSREWTADTDTGVDTGKLPTGCGCDAAPGVGASWLGVLVGLGLVMRRRA